MKLSIAIITYNSEKYLEQVLQSCKFADEVILVDSGSTDKTLSIATKFDNVKIYHQDWLGFSKQKQLAVNLTKNNWVFVLDSDEIITNSLAEEIKDVLRKPIFVGYYVPRLNYFFGKPIKRCGLYPDKTIRLFDKNYAKFDNRIVHEKILVNGKCGSMKSHLIHMAYDSIEEFINKQNRYSTLAAKFDKKRAIFSPLWTFIKMYILKLGFLEGWRGFIISALYSQYVFWKYIKKNY